jgi:hypothetical protein
LALLSYRLPAYPRTAAGCEETVRNTSRANWKKFTVDVGKVDGHPCSHNEFQSDQPAAITELLPIVCYIIGYSQSHPRPTDKTVASGNIE